jgi:hypothetical protein
MRFIVLITALGLIGWSSPELREWTGILVPERSDPRAAAAIELRCASEMDAFRDDCAEELQKNFDLGVREPEAILRLHCTRYTNEWSLTPSAAPSICEEMYGGWIES